MDALNAFQAPPLISAILLTLILAVGNALALFQVHLGATGRLPFTGIAGIKTPATRESQAAWEAGHRAAWPWALAGNGGAILAAVAMLFAKDSAAPWLLALGAAILLAGIGVVGGLIAAHRAAKRASR